VKEQLRPTIPHDTPRQLANLIRSCWKDTPAERPSFFKIVRRLKQMLQELAEDEVEKRRLRVEYERELAAAASSGGGILNMLKHKRDDLRGSTGTTNSDEPDDLVHTINPLWRLRKATVAEDKNPVINVTAPPEQAPEELVLTINPLLRLRKASDGLGPLSPRATVSSSSNEAGLNLKRALEGKGYRHKKSSAKLVDNKEKKDSS